MTSAVPSASFQIQNARYRSSVFSRTTTISKASCTESEPLGALVRDAIGIEIQRIRSATVAYGPQCQTGV